MAARARKRLVANTVQGQAQTINFSWLAPYNAKLVECLFVIGAGATVPLSFFSLSYDDQVPVSYLQWFIDPYDIGGTTFDFNDTFEFSKGDTLRFAYPNLEDADNNLLIVVKEVD